MTDTAAQPRTARRPAGWALLGAWVLLAAVVWWLVGSLSGLLDQVLDALTRLAQGTPGPSARVPAPAVLALPLSAYGLQVPNWLLGGLLAGLLGRPAGRERPGVAAGVTLAGVLLALSAVLVHAVLVPDTLGTFPMDSREGAATALSMVLVSVLGWLLGASALLGRAGAGMALGAVAGVLPTWSAGLWIVVAARSPQDGIDLGWTTWVGPLVLVGALAVVGLRPASRTAWWVPVVVLSWTAHALGWALLLLVDHPLAAAVPGGSVGQALGDAVVAAVRDPLPWGSAVVVAAGVALVLDRRRRAVSSSVAR